MSDSTMKPKELPKTCGNCEDRRSGRMMCDSNPYWHEGCGFWKESRASLQQRNQQLSKLTQDMHRIIATAERNQSTIFEGVSARLLGRMEALGVEADG